MRRPKPSFDPIEEAYLYGHPNPERHECPGLEVLRQLALKQLPVSDPARLHIANCSPCFQEFRAFQRQMANARRRHRIYQIAIAAVLVLVVGIGILTWRSVGGGDQHSQAAMLNFAASITRGIGSDEQSEPGSIQLYPRKVLLLTMSLPPGSEDGVYEFQVTSPDEKKPLIEAQTKAHIANGLTTITEKVDFSRLQPGLYIARLKHPPFGQWRRVPIRIE